MSVAAAASTLPVAPIQVAPRSEEANESAAERSREAAAAARPAAAKPPGVGESVDIRA